MFVPRRRDSTLWPLQAGSKFGHPRHSRGGGRSSAGLELKNPSGRSEKPIDETGMTGQSSMRGMWVKPKVYHRTRSVSAILRSAFVHFASPVSSGF